MLLLGFAEICGYVQGSRPQQLPPVYRMIYDAPLRLMSCYAPATDSQALDVDPATGLLEGDEDEEGYEEEYPLEQLNIATADFMAKVCVCWCKIVECRQKKSLGSRSVSVTFPLFRRDDGFTWFGLFDGGGEPMGKFCVCASRIPVPSLATSTILK